MDNQEMTYAVVQNLTSIGFSCTGYTFGGWKLSLDSPGIDFTNGQSVINLASESDAIVTLYATWNLDVKLSPSGQYNITVDGAAAYTSDNIAAIKSSAVLDNKVIMTVHIGCYTIVFDNNALRSLTEADAELSVTETSVPDSLT